MAISFWRIIYGLIDIFQRSATRNMLCQTAGAREKNFPDLNARERAQRQFS